MVLPECAFLNQQDVSFQALIDDTLMREFNMLKPFVPLLQGHIVTLESPGYPMAPGHIGRGSFPLPRVFVSNIVHLIGT